MIQAFQTAADVTSYQDAAALDMQSNDGKSNQRASSPTKSPASFAKKTKLEIGCVSSGALWM